MKSSLARTGERFDRYTRELHEHGLESVDREVRWLTELIESERTEPSPDQTDSPDMNAPDHRPRPTRARPDQKEEP